MTSSKKDRNRPALSEEDRVLWERVKQTARPLRKQSPEAATGMEKSPDKAASEQTKRVKPRPTEAAGATKLKTNDDRPRSPVSANPGRAPGINPLDRRTVQRIARGSTAIDGRIDLHGMTQRNAHGRLLTFLAGCQARGDKVVLVITGKGSQRPEDSGAVREVGVLRRAVPLWLQEPAFRSMVVGYERAHKTHGGDGALYVRLRRRHGDAIR